MATLSYVGTIHTWSVSLASSMSSFLNPSRKG
jgi:hypothetical protein